MPMVPMVLPVLPVLKPVRARGLLQVLRAQPESRVLLRARRPGIRPRRF